MTITPKHKPLSLLALAIIFVMLAMPVYAGGGKVSGDSDDLVSAFEEMHAVVINKAKQGTLPAETANQADELNVELQKYIIQKEAELEILQLDALHGSKAKREAAMAEIVRISAKLERTKMAYLQRMQSLLSSDGTEKPVALPTVASPKKETTAKGTKEDEEGIKWRTKELDFEIEIAPEDITKGDRE